MLESVLNNVDEDGSVALDAESAPTRDTHGVAEASAPRFAHYKIATTADGSMVELGRGAMGVTYQAIDTTLNYAVALKVINRDLATHPRARARFLREAQAAAGLRHPHIASVFFFGEQAGTGQPFYAMELVEGETLHERVRRVGGLPVEAVLEIGAQVAGALSAAGARALTHRDLKPANVMLVAGGGINVKIIDFGLAKAAATDPGATDPHLTGAEDFVGTPAFASPEQFDNHLRLDARSDFYALGATLWYALTGKTPFAGRTLGEIHHRQVHEPPSLAQLQVARVPPLLVELLRSLLSPEPAGRPQTAGELAAALERCRAQIAAPVPRSHWWMATAAVGLLFVLLAVGGFVYEHTHLRPPVTASPLEKSIAVLPFDNLSEDKDNAFFADGVQDEILTDLARIADLKVISRTSVLSYRDPAKRPPARDIAHALGVSYLLEGSVQRQGGRVRLSAQLIDATHDRHVWADTYDRDLADVFSIQSEVADTIAGKLQAQFSGKEKAIIDQPPTHDFAAYELYLHAKDLMYNWDPNTAKWDTLHEAERLLDEATTRDPDFYAAWCLLTNIHGNLLFFNADPTPTARTALAERSLENARRLRPDAGETHLAAAIYHYNIHDPAHGRPELDVARQKLPNNWRVLFVTGTTGMIDGRWAESAAAMEKARTLNPRHLPTLDMLTIIYGALRRYEDAKRVAEDAIAAGINPDYFAMRHAIIVQNQTGDTTELHAVFRRLAGQGEPSERTLIVRWDTALRDRDFDEAARVVAADPRKEYFVRTTIVMPRSTLTGNIAFMRGDLAAARKDYETVRPVFEEAIRRRPTDATSWMMLADLDARLGRKADALREGQQSVALLPISRDASEGPKLATSLSQDYSLVGEEDRGMTLLESLVKVPNAFDYGYLKTHPDFDAFRSDPRFEALLQAVRKPIDLSKFNPADFSPPAATPSLSSLTPAP